MSTPQPNPTLHPQEAAAHQRKMILRTVRFAFVALLLSVTLVRLLGVGNASAEGEKELVRLWYLTFGVAAALAAIFVVVDLMTPRKKIATLTGVFAGLLFGLIATAALSLIIDLPATTSDRKSTRLHS